ncbi:MAG: ribosomal large subunit pseudouridine synthase [Candidatus Berkelbacteria bacterium]|nr:ribosomal large subunit pseudouridine synthase [Candidatus Berkelbacteria bacterium]
MEIKKIYEDNNMVVIEKPAGLIVHPGAGVHTETLVDWLILNYPEIKDLNWPEKERPGIVHRLDKDTSGIMIIAKNPETLEKFQAKFQAHEIKKTYLTLVFGKLAKPEGEITGFISRDPNARRQQTTQSIHFDFQPGKARTAKTYYKVIKEYRFNNEVLSLIEAKIETGRMHQIRVHFKSIGHPVIGDPIYNIKHSKRISKELGLNRQFLHACKLEFDNHKFESILPNDLELILQKFS